MKDTYLITGSSGFIGSHLVDRLLSEGVSPSSLRLVDRNNPTIDRHKRLQFYKGDLQNPSFAKKVMDKATIVYHLAATSGFGGETIQEYRKGNVTTTTNLLQFHTETRLKKFIFFSSIAVYGLPSGVGDIINWDETHPFSYSEVYGQSKKETEDVVRLYGLKHNVPYAILRPVSVYGPRDFGQLFGMYNAIQGNYFFLIGTGNNVMDFIYVDDLLTGALQVAQEKLQNQEYILGSGAPISVKQITETIALSLGKSTTFLSIPIHIALPLSYGMQYVSKLTKKQLPLFPSRVKILTSSYYYNISKAKKQLNFLPKTSFQSGIAHMTEWYKSLRS